MIYTDPVAQTYLDEQLEEGLAKHIATAALGIALATGISNKSSDPIDKSSISANVQQKKSSTVSELAQGIKSKYGHLSDDFVNHVASLAKKHEKETFPRAEDILAISGIESSFRPEAKSNLKHDPAIGLMQMRPRVHGLKKRDLTSVDQQIALGADLLHHYYKRTGDEHDAVHAYNVGITNFRQGKKLNPNYVEKFKKEKELYI